MQYNYINWLGNLRPLKNTIQQIQTLRFAQIFGSTLIFKKELVDSKWHSITRLIIYTYYYVITHKLHPIMIIAKIQIS